MLLSLSHVSHLLHKVSVRLRSNYDFLALWVCSCNLVWSMLVQSNSMPWGYGNNQIVQTWPTVHDKTASIQTYETGKSWQIGVLIIQTFQRGRAAQEGKTTSFVQLNLNRQSEGVLIYIFIYMGRQEEKDIRFQYNEESNRESIFTVESNQRVSYIIIILSSVLTLKTAADKFFSLQGALSTCFWCLNTHDLLQQMVYIMEFKGALQW